jgi:hypothetical protein
MTKTHGENKRELHTGEFNDIVHTCNINDITCEEGNIKTWQQSVILSIKFQWVNYLLRLSHYW